MKKLSLSLSLSLSVFTLLVLSTFILSCGNKETKPAAKTVDQLIDSAETLTMEEFKILPDYKYPLNQPLPKDFEKGKKKNLLILYRNSIFAQYGYEFKTKWIKDYFLTRPWYKPGGYRYEMMTKIDNDNINTLKKTEDEMDGKDGKVVSEGKGNDYISRFLKDINNYNISVEGMGPSAGKDKGDGFYLISSNTKRGIIKGEFGHAAAAEVFYEKINGIWELIDNKIILNYESYLINSTGAMLRKKESYNIEIIDYKDGVLTFKDRGTHSVELKKKNN